MDGRDGGVVETVERGGKAIALGRASAALAGSAPASRASRAPRMRWRSSPAAFSVKVMATTDEMGGASGPDRQAR